MKKWTVVEEVSTYGFPTIKVWNSAGGDFGAMDFRSDPESPDKFMYTLVNEHGLGGSYYSQTVQKIIDSVNLCVWIPDEVKARITTMLMAWEAAIDG